MLPVLITVILTSFSGVMVPGPMLAVTVAKSLRSPRAGMWMSFGHAVVEIPLILLLFLGLERYMMNSFLHLALGLLGGGMIVWMAITMFRSRNAVSGEEQDTPHGAFISGILLTGLNPLVLVWWVTIGSLLLLNFLETVGNAGLPLFIFVHWLCDFVWLSLVSFTIYRARRLWIAKMQKWAFVVLATGLLYFGIKIAVDAVLKFG